MATATANVSFKEMVNNVDMGPGAGSIQFQFAKMQLLLAEMNKSKAMAVMDEISASQDKAKEIAGLIESARGQQKDNIPTGNATVTSAYTYRFCKPIKDFCDANGIRYPSTGSPSTAQTDWDYVITSLSNLQETVGVDTSQKMVFLQDYMGQYNSYLTGSSSTVQQGIQTLQTIARGQ
ncbi:MAG: USH1C-binding protein 1 [Deltaproteobacteria bacterium]|jgi:hypothetical protein|nr:USH1C-binding protein 1 [Deltaproteobacteria bacterium]